jgi:hypothetical protein
VTGFWVVLAFAPLLVLAASDDPRAWLTRRRAPVLAAVSAVVAVATVLGFWLWPQLPTWGRLIVSIVYAVVLWGAIALWLKRFGSNVRKGWSEGERRDS